MTNETTGFLFFQERNEKGYYVPAPSLDEAIDLFILKVNDEYLPEWKWEFLSYNDDMIALWSEKRKIIIVFIIISFEYNTPMKFDFSLGSKW